MTIPVWILLGFTLWTLLILCTCVGSYRIARIFTRKSPVKEYSFPDLDQSDWHRRATRTHLNCVENLPIYGAIVLVIVVTGLKSAVLDTLAVIFLTGRVAQSLTQLFFRQSGRVTVVRFHFFAIQWFCMFGMALYVIFKSFN